MKAVLLMFTLLLCGSCKRTFACECTYHPYAPAGENERMVYTFESSKPSAENSCSALEYRAPKPHPHARVCSLQ